MSDENATVADDEIEIQDEAGDCLRINGKGDDILIEIVNGSTGERHLPIIMNEAQARAALAALQTMINRVFGPKGE